MDEGSDKKELFVMGQSDCRIRNNKQEFSTDQQAIRQKLLTVGWELPFMISDVPS